VKRRALILDRDGVVNIDTGYPHRIEECRFIDGIFELVRAFHEHDFVIVVATNQAGIGRGYYGETEFRALMDWMCGHFDGRIAAVYHCPFHPEGIGAYRRDSPWRKPAPGMLLQAARDLNLDLARSWMVGDRETDIEAACRAHIGTIVLFDPTGSEATIRAGDHWRVSSLAAVVTLLERDRDP
jgi:D-glycero-D-manno-heptose 1,7-bisphosphate phosphatase